jgi:hypothetical protein
MANRLSRRRPEKHEIATHIAEVEVHSLASQQPSAAAPVPPPGGQPFVVLAGWEYNGTSPFELSFVRGEALAIISTKHELWWEARGIGGRCACIETLYDKVCAQMLVDSILVCI